MCQLKFYSNKNKKYGPYGSASSSRGYYEGKRLSMIFLSIFFKVFNSFFRIFVFILWIVNNVPRDWSGAIKMDRFPVGFAGASVSFQPVKKTWTTAMNHPGLSWRTFNSLILKFDIVELPYLFFLFYSFLFELGIEFCKRLNSSINFQIFFAMI